VKILLVYPLYPDTFWSFKHALKFISKKAAHPPLGLLTVAAMLPNEWEKKLVDMNTISLSDRDLKWADYVFISAMAVQKDSARSVIRKCQKQGVKVVAGGPLFTMEYQEFDGVDHFVLNEAEITLPPFLEDLNNGCARHVYTSAEWPDIKATPIPSWELVDMRKYSSMSVQYSRGCPFDCEFCDIIVLNGHVPRTKDKDQMLRELNALYDRGWRNSIFIVDDNFIGNKRKLKTQILPAIIEWMKEKGYPFSLFTEASINLADDEELIRLVVEANFNMVFVGIETPNEESLAECGKFHNKNRDLMASVRKLQNHGLQVQGGFIIGFDSDPPSIFESQISFIQRSGIVTAMVGLLNAPIGTKLYRRLKSENRLLSDFSGDNTDCSINFVPKMNYETLMSGYRKIISTIYAPNQYYARLKTFLKEYKPRRGKAVHPQFGHLRSFAKSMWFLGLKGKGKRYYWRLLAWTLVRRPRSFPISVTLAIYGYHFRRVVEEYIGTAMRNTHGFRVTEESGG
jgi:radical SAM superfamily enzyme YgiQ (UPF0313 family)